MADTEPMRRYRVRVNLGVRMWGGPLYQHVTVPATSEDEAARRALSEIRPHVESYSDIRELS